VTADLQRRAALNQVKLRALVTGHTGRAPQTPTHFGDGAAARQDDQAWVLPDARPARALGPGLAWAHQAGARHLHLVVDDPVAAGVLARRAGWFATPATVWVVEGRRLHLAETASFLPTMAVDERVAHLVPVIEAGGADPVIEHGVVAGEVAGLEVCRAVIDADDGQARLEVGIGDHDREAFRLLYGDRPAPEALAAVVRSVRAHRAPDAPPHPLNRLAASRRLRARLLDDPSLVDAVALEAVPPPVPRVNLKDEVPCVAAGVDRAGRPLVMVCSTGVDLDVVPFAADARAATGPPGAHLVVAVPERDDHPVTRRMAAALTEPAAVVGIPNGRLSCD
jgi:hypothetical protein